MSAVDTFIASYEQRELERKNALNEELAVRRKKLREKLIINLIVEEGAERIFEGTFDGYGDSGQYNQDSGNKEVDDFFSDFIQANATHFDWWNNEGGGGDITWNVDTDVITINGYYNVTHREDVMIDEEF